MKEDVQQSIEIQKPDTTRKTFSISRPRVTSKKEPEAPSPSKKSFAISKPKLAEISAKGTYVNPSKIKKMSRTKLRELAKSSFKPTEARISLVFKHSSHCLKFLEVLLKFLESFLKKRHQ